MITCAHCGVHYEVFRSICPSCGAPLQIEKPADSKKTEAQFLAQKIRLICDDYINSDFKDGESITDKMMDKIRKSFRVFPNGKEIFFYCDTSPFRTGKQGFLICEDGIYWQNTWTTSTNRNFLAWDVFKNRELAHKQYDMELGKGDVIDVSGLGDDTLRETVVKLLKQIQNALNEQD